MLLKNVSRLKIMFLTDIHLNHQGIDKLEQWILQHYNTQSNFDYCLIGGDTANCNYEKNSHDEEDMHNQTAIVMKRIKNMLGCKLLFIPGNHDCKDFFIDERKNQIFINIHNKIIQLCEGLHILGFGGSTPGYLINSPNDAHEQLYWSGYPYTSEGDLRKEWEKGSLGKILDGWDKTNPQTQLILLTHIGPKKSATTLDTLDAPPQIVSSGSEFLNRMLDKEYNLCWLHGHTHNGSKFVMEKGLPIINPGAMKNNEFMYFQLMKDNNEWKVATKVFEALM